MLCRWSYSPPVPGTYTRQIGHGELLKWLVLISPVPEKGVFAVSRFPIRAKGQKPVL